MVKKTNKLRVKYLGKNKLNTREALLEKLNINDNELKDIQDNKTRILYNEKNGNITKVNLQDSPLLIREFGIPRINNKLITGGPIKKGFTVLKDDFPLDKRVSGTIIANIYAQHISSENVIQKVITININNTFINSERAIKEDIKETFEAQKPIYKEFEIQWDMSKIEFYGYNQIKFEIDDMKMREQKPLNISSLFGDNIIISETKENCVRDYLIAHYHKNGKGIGKKAIISLGDKNGVSPKELKEFCIKYKIKLIIYDIKGDLIASNYECKKDFKALIGIVYNNHFYPLKNDYLKRINKPNINNEIYTKNIKKDLIKFLNDGIHPADIKIKGNEITYFQIDDTIYHTNEEAEQVKNILEKLGLLDHYNCFLTLASVSTVIEKAFFIDDKGKEINIDSYFPYNSNVGGYNFFNKNIKESEDIETIDHCNHYAESLKELDLLIKIDIKSAKHIIKPEKLEPNFLYIARPKKSSILMPRCGFYDYFYLSYCLNEGLEFELLEAMGCEYVENIYKNMLKTLYEKLDIKQYKAIYCRLIGLMENKPLTKDVVKFEKIANADETKTSNGFFKVLNNDYNMFFKTETIANKNIFNKVPIRVQIITNARKIVYEQMKKMGLSMRDIKQVKTDAISFIKSKKKIINEGNNPGQWKKEQPTFFKDEILEEDKIETFKLQPINNNNKIYEDYAGSGKTHYIINSLIPKLGDDYIVLSPSHSTITEYKKLNINCNVIQTYYYNFNIPTEQNIIIDEIGMVDSLCNNIIIKSALENKNIYSFGDFQQLEPVKGKVCNSDIYLNYLYSKRKSLGTNYRNNFTKEYYDKLINMTKSKEIIKEVSKYNTKKYYEADVIVCYKNETREKYNKLMLDYHNLKFGDKGCVVVCKTNKLRQYKLYNNKYLTVQSKTKEEITLYDGVDTITIPLKDFNKYKYFEAGYARTLYNIQGQSVKSFYYCLEDIEFLSDRSLYTLISRLKQELINKPKPKEKEPEPEKYDFFDDSEDE